MTSILTPINEEPNQTTPTGEQTPTPSEVGDDRLIIPMTLLPTNNDLTFNISSSADAKTPDLFRSSFGDSTDQLEVFKKLFSNTNNDFKETLDRIQSSRLSPCESYKVATDDETADENKKKRNEFMNSVFEQNMSFYDVINPLLEEEFLKLVKKKSKNYSTFFAGIQANLDESYSKIKKISILDKKEREKFLSMSKEFGEYRNFDDILDSYSEKLEEYKKQYSSILPANEKPILDSPLLNSNLIDSEKKLLEEEILKNKELIKKIFNFVIRLEIIKNNKNIENINDNSSFLNDISRELEYKFFNGIFLHDIYEKDKVILEKMEKNMSEEKFKELKKKFYFISFNDYDYNKHENMNKLLFIAEGIGKEINEANFDLKKEISFFTIVNIVFNLFAKELYFLNNSNKNNLNFNLNLPIDIIELLKTVESSLSENEIKTSLKIDIFISLYNILGPKCTILNSTFNYLKKNYLDKNNRQNENINFSLENKDCYYLTIETIKSLETNIRCIFLKNPTIKNNLIEVIEKNTKNFVEKAEYNFKICESQIKLKNNNNINDTLEKNYNEIIFNVLNTIENFFIINKFNFKFCKKNQYLKKELIFLIEKHFSFFSFFYLYEKQNLYYKYFITSGTKEENNFLDSATTYKLLESQKENFIYSVNFKRIISAMNKILYLLIEESDCFKSVELCKETKFLFHDNLNKNNETYISKSILLYELLYNDLVLNNDSMIHYEKISSQILDFSYFNYLEIKGFAKNICKYIKTAESKVQKKETKNQDILITKTLIDKMFIVNCLINFIVHKIYLFKSQGMDHNLFKIMDLSYDKNIEDIEDVCCKYVNPSITKVILINFIQKLEKEYEKTQHKRLKHDDQRLVENPLKIENDQTTLGDQSLVVDVFKSKKTSIFSSNKKYFFFFSLILIIPCLTYLLYNSVTKNKTRKKNSLNNSVKKNEK